jgi:lipopolysaccharide transport system permease protein
MRELKARYRGTALGFLWFMLNPLVFTVVYVVVFSTIFHEEIKHFPVFILSGVLPWTCFTSSINESTTSIISNGNLIKKAVIPSEIFPLVYVGTNTLHYLFSIPILLFFTIYSGIPISWNWAYFPLILCLQAMFTYGLALIVSALTVQFRDFQQMVPNLLLILFFLTPVVYPLTSVGNETRSLMEASPTTFLIESYRDIFFYGKAPSLWAVSSWLCFPALCWRSDLLFSMPALNLLPKRSNIDSH